MISRAKITAICSSFPPTAVAQDVLSDRFQAAAQQDGASTVMLRRLKKIFAHSSVRTRYVAMPWDETARNWDAPIETRQMWFREHVQTPVISAARDAIRRSGVDAGQIGRIVTASSTGFLAPGLDALLIDHIGLLPSVSRLHIGFMGCGAAMNALDPAIEFVHGQPQRAALLVSAELSSVNATPIDTSNGPKGMNQLVGHALFGDGCAAAVLQDTAADSSIDIIDRHSLYLENTHDGIVLDVSRHGATVTLARSLPEYIERGVGLWVNQVLQRHHLAQRDIDLWAVHAGGARILESVQHTLGLSAEQLRCSWDLLHDHGNVLSASTLCVLERMQAQGMRGLGLAFAFSPGVVIEGMLFRIR